MTKNDWDITNRSHTRTKLEILRKVFGMWLTIWNGPKQQKWVSKEWYVLDLFAGRGYYDDYSNKEKKEISGSPIIFLEEVLAKKDKLNKNAIKIKLFLVEIKKREFNTLKNRYKSFIKTYPEMKNIVEVKFYRDNCNKIIKKILTDIRNTSKNPLFILVDPWGLQIKKATLQEISKLKNPKDIVLNYILEGVRRVSGVVKKAQQGEKLNVKEIKTVKTFYEFLGRNIDIITKTDRKILEEYISVFRKRDLNIVGYDMPYPDKRDTIYYLLYASRRQKVTDIVKSIYHKERQKRNLQKTLFGDEYEKESIFLANSKSKVIHITRKSLLYKTKVEYGDWTINHIIGCMHGCKFPCYAMMMAKKFGWVKNYEDWRKPRLAINALELLDQEIPKYKKEIKHFVHLCFMSDPFMYDYEEKDLIPEIKEMTLKIIEKLNKNGIKVTTLTKGFYPDEILDKNRFLPTNEYGITLVSLNEDFKKEYEPYSAPYERRIESLKKLAKAGLKTWVSMEPYPTPNLPRLERTGAENIEKILEKIKFVRKIIFGKLNYSRLNYYNGSYTSTWKDSNDFYKEMAKKVINFCKKNNIKHHIKFGTPFSRKNTANIFKD